MQERHCTHLTVRKLKQQLKVGYSKLFITSFLQLDFKTTSHVFLCAYPAYGH